MKLPKAWFLPRNPDVLGLLRKQAATVHLSVTALESWAQGDGSDADVLGPLVTQAEERRAVLLAVREAFSTPLEAEDVFELAQRLSEIAEAAYMLVREADLSRTGPDSHLAAMITAVATAFGKLGEALEMLPRGDAAGIADRAVATLDAAEHAYRQGIAGLESEPDPRREIRLRELYRRAEHLVLATQRLGRRTWYAVCKIS